jgi:hypothetical protein
MEFAKTLILNEIIDGIEATYEEFLKVKNLPDTTLVSAGFYAAVEASVRNDPHPDADLQQELVNYLAAAVRDDVDNYREEVEMMFMDVTSRLMA